MLLPPRRQRALLLAAPLALALAACGGGSGSAETSGPPAPAGLTVGYGVKAYHFSWNASANASRYELFEDPDGAAGPMPEVQVGGALGGTSYTHSLAPQMLHERVNASYRLRACDAGSCGALTAAWVPDLTKAIGYFKASNSGDHDGYGASVALSTDGSTLAVGAPGESSGAAGLNGDQADNSVEGAGAVYVFARSGSGWSQQAYVKASNPRAVPVKAGYPSSLGWALFGASLSLSADGSTLAVGAPGEASNARGTDGDQNNVEAPGAGAVYVFQRSGGAWSQQAYVKASNTAPAATYRTDIAAGYYVLNAAEFGKSISLSADGKVLAVGAPGEQGNATRTNGNQDDTSTDDAGAVYMFAFGTSWSQQAYLKASTIAQGRFGTSVSLAGNARTLAVGSWNDVHVFSGESGTWGQQAHLAGSTLAPLADAATRLAFFGTTTALAADGGTLAIGALYEPTRPGEYGVMATAYVFGRANGAWTQQTRLQIDRQTGAWVSAALALSADGNTLALGTGADSSSATGINSTRLPQGQQHRQGRPFWRQHGPVGRRAHVGRWCCRGRQQGHRPARRPV
jgi:hypothetical protein